MSAVARKKVHFAPLAAQERQIKRLIREGRYANVTQFMRCAIDAYLERLGRPTLVEQAQQMAEDWSATHEDAGDSRLQDRSRRSSEKW